MGSYISNNTTNQVEVEPQNQAEDAPLPAFVVPAHLQFTAGQLTALINAGQQPGVPFQIGETNAQRAVGERKQARVVELAANIRKNSIYFRRMSKDGTKLCVGFKYDSKLPLQLSIYVTAKDRSDTSKLKISESRAVLGPFNIRAGEDVEWNSHQEEEYVDTLALSDKPRKENSLGYDIIIVTRTLFPKGVSRPEKAMVFLATMCRLPSPGSIYVIDQDEADDHEKNIFKTFPLSCILQKTQSKTGVFSLEDIYGLETLTGTKCDDAKSDEGSTSGDCVICLSDQSSVALYPCRHWCVCMACAEALPSQQNTCPVCRQPFILLLDFKKSEGMKSDPADVEE